MDVVRYLVDVVKVNIHKVDPYGRSPRDIASFFGYKETLNILENAKEDKRKTSKTARSDSSKSDSSDSSEDAANHVQLSK